MMDDKKIEEVAKVYMIGEFYDRDEAEWNYPITNEEKRNQCIIDFKAGAKWAINEFLKDLWHPNTEKPDKSKSLPLVLITMLIYNLKNPFFGIRNLGDIRLADAKSSSGLIYLTKEAINEDFYF